MKVKKIIYALAFALSVNAGTVSAGGIPVIDVANLANTAANLQEWSKQLTEMKNQLGQLQQTYNSLNGLRNVGSLLNNELLVQYLPRDYQTSLTALLNGTGGDFAGISGTLNNIVAANQVYSCSTLNTDPALINQCKSQWNKLALDKNIGDAGYKQASKNIDNLQSFVSSINTSSDPKSLQDLQARIAVEQVRMQNEQVKLETIKMMVAADEKLQTQKRRDAFQSGLNMGADGGISF